MLKAETAATPARQRIVLIDVARGIALGAMAIYHFTWDLEFFGWNAPGTIQQTGWVLFARCIASSFLFLVGISLVLAHRSGIRWPGFWKRLAMVAGSAALISITTYWFTPDTFIFFGILHAIALYSILALPFLKIPWWLTGVTAVAIIVIAQTVSHDFFNNPALWWVGLATDPPPSNDYVPLFPWFAPVLLGVTTATVTPAGIWDRLRGTPVVKTGTPTQQRGVNLHGPAQRTLGFLGRHSLAFYLVHQPILIGSLWLFTQIAGPPDATQNFIAACERSCSRTAGSTFCTRFCTCTTDALKSANLWEGVQNREIDITGDPRILEISETCTANSK